VHVWDLVTAQPRTVWPGSGENFGPLGLVAAPDGTWLATGSADYEVRVWDPVTGELRASLKPGGRTASSIAVARVARSDLADGVVSAAFSPDDRWLAVVTTDGLLRVWRTSTWTVAAAIRVDVRTPGQSHWLADGTGICVLGDLAAGYPVAFLFDFDPGAWTEH
jgi:WD40 repeat protein